MIALHLAFDNEDILLWSEAETIGDLEDLRKAIKALKAHLSLISRVEELYAWLPSKRKKEIPSNPLISEYPEGKHIIKTKAHNDETAFWGKQQSQISLPSIIPKFHAALPKRLGPISFWAYFLVIDHYLLICFPDLHILRLKISSLFAD